MGRGFTRDPWEELRAYTSARIALGRAGSSLPTGALLAFQMHHARAMDAVGAAIDRDALAEALAGLGYETIALDTLAGNHEEFLQRPDYGRRLSEGSREALERFVKDRRAPEVVLAVVDGLSATAVHRHAAPVIGLLGEALRAEGISVGAIPLVRHGRVALQDEIGAMMGAQVVVSFIGERPGLGSPDSLGAYLVYRPALGNTDANRNCISNIRPEGLTHEAAATTAGWLIREALRRRISGIELKDDRVLVTGDSAGRLPVE